MVNSALETKNLSIGHKVNEPIMEELNLSVKEGELIALIGENGKGKSTLLKTLCGINKALNGNILLQGEKLSNLNSSQLAALISVVLTEKINIGSIRVQDLISFGRYPFTNWLGIQNQKDRDQVEEAIALCNLQQFRNKPFFELSDGEKQKVMIARCIAQGAKIMLLDEPTAHLDMTNSIKIVQLLRNLCDSKGITIIYATHQIELALKTSTHIWLMNNKSIIQGKPRQVVNSGAFEEAFPMSASYWNLDAYK